MKKITPIKKKFCSKVKEELQQAVVTYLAFTEGVDKIRLNAKQNPNKKVEIKEHTSNTAYLTIHMGLTHKSALKMLKKNPHHVIEMFHGQLVQAWFDFLGDIFNLMVLDVLSGTRNWPLPKTNPQIDLREIKSKNSRVLLADSIRHWFNFLPSSKKREIVFRALSSAKSITQYLEKIKSHAESIEKNVTIRNLIQHHHGRVRHQDLKKHGLEHFEIILSDTKNIEVKAKQKIYITYKTLENLGESMSLVAEAIRKTWIVSAI